MSGDISAHFNDHGLYRNPRLMEEGAVGKPNRAEARRAAQTVLGSATDAADAAQLLDMLGIDPHLLREENP
jgi:hypothetical protein